jgi:hypothetical protein
VILKLNCMAEEKRFGGKNLDMLLIAVRAS